MSYQGKVGVVALLVSLLPSLCLGQEEIRVPEEGAVTLSLPEAVALALAHHPAVSQAEARRVMAEGVMSQAQASLLPSLQVGASVTRYQEPMLVAPLHRFDPAAAPNFDRNLVRGNLSLGYLLYDGGARGARIRSAEAGHDLALVGERGAQMDVAVQVSRSYVEFLSSQELLEAAAAQRAALEAEQDRVRQFLEVGKAARVDLLRVQAALSRAEATEISVRTGLAVVRGHLGRLTGLEVSELEDRTLLPVRVRADANPGSEEARILAEEANPELSLARQRVAVAEAGKRQARAQWFPELRVGGAYNDFGAVRGSHTQEWQGSIQLSYPLFTGGARDAELHTAEAETEEAREEYRLAELGVEDGVEQALASLVEAQALRAALEAGVQQAQEVARIEALALEVGSGVQTDFLRSQAELFQVRASLVQARHQETLASIQLARVTGQLDLRWFQDNMEVVP